MKKLLLLFMLLAFLSSCSPSFTHIARVTHIQVIDYIKYAEEDFLITPNSYTYDFIGIGEIFITITPATERDTVKSIHSYDKNGKPFYITQTGFVEEKISINEMIDIAVNEAKKMGADAITNFEIRRNYNNGFLFNGKYIYPYEVLGYCIKRKNL